MKSILNLPSELQCHKIFYQIFYGQCPKCHCKNKIAIKAKYEYCQACHHKTSAKASTLLFSYNQLSYRQLAALLWCWQYHFATAQTAKIVGISFTTAQRWLKTFDGTKGKERQNLMRLISKFEN